MLKICSSSIIVLIAYKIFTKITKNLLTKWCPHCILNKSIARATKWNLSSAGRASALQAEGHRFEPYRFHSNFGWSYGEIAQLARACGSYPQCRGFESPSRYYISKVLVIQGLSFFLSCVSITLFRLYPHLPFCYNS